MRKLKNIPLIVIISSSLFIGASTLTRGHEWGDDFAAYIMQAQSVLNGNMDEFIERNTFTILKSSFQIGPVAYPWGYPLILIPSLLLKGLHPLALKLPGLIFFAGFLICLYRLTENRLTLTGRLILVSLCAFNPILTNHLDQILSDIPFLFFVFLALILIAKFAPQEAAGKSILTGTVIFLAFFIRTTGIILLAGFLVQQAIALYVHREKRKSVTRSAMAVSGVFILLWFITSLIFPNGQGAYFRQLMGFTWDAFLTRNIPGYFYLGAQFFGIRPDTAWMYFYYVLIALFILGAWLRRNPDHPILIFFLLYLGAMVVWPEWQGIRFVFPVLPVFLYFAIHGVDAAIQKIPVRFRTLSAVTTYLLWFALAGNFLFNSGTGAIKNLQDGRKINGPFDSYSDEVFQYIREETTSDSVIVFFKPRAMRLFTDRDSLMVLECENLSLGDYVVIHKNWEYSQILPGDIPECRQPLKNDFENQRFIVYEVMK